MARRDVLRDCFDMIQWTKNYARENGVPMQALEKLIRDYRNKIHSINLMMADPLEKSMRDEWRHRIDEDGECGTDYACMKDDGETDEEIQDFIDSEVGYPPINSPYDCTGKPFTMYTNWKRAHGMIIMIHRWGLDV